MSFYPEHICELHIIQQCVKFNHKSCK